MSGNRGDGLNFGGGLLRDMDARFWGAFGCPPSRFKRLLGRLNYLKSLLRCGLHGYQRGAKDNEIKKFPNTKDEGFQYIWIVRVTYPLVKMSDLLDEVVVKYSWIRNASSR